MSSNTLEAEYCLDMLLKVLIDTANIVKYIKYIF